MPFQPGPARRHDGLVGGRASWLAASKPRSKPCGSVTLYVRQSHAAPLSSLPLPVWINPCSHLANFGLHVAPKSAQNELYLVPVGCRFVTLISLHLAQICHCAAQFAPFWPCSNVGTNPALACCQPVLPLRVQLSVGSRLATILLDY